MQGNPRGRVPKVWGWTASVMIAAICGAGIPANAFVIERVSVDLSRNQGNRDSSGVTLSPDGRYAAFVSDSTNLATGDTNFHRDIFVHDRITGTTELVSVSTGGTQGNDDSGIMGRPVLSADGRYVGFDSYATNLVTGDSNNRPDVFLRDRCISDGTPIPACTPTTERVSIDSNGNQGDNTSLLPSLSADARYVAFTSLATNLVVEDTNGGWDVFVRDRCLSNGTPVSGCTPATERVSVSTDGAEGDSDSIAPFISPDGRYAAFISDASNLVVGDSNGVSDIFVHDRCLANGTPVPSCTPTTERVSVDSAGAEGNRGSGPYFFPPSLSADGRYVAFDSRASNLVEGDTNATADVFVHDRCLSNGVPVPSCTPSTEAVSVNAAGHSGNKESRLPALSEDGRFVAFVSDATNLTSGDTNRKADIFLRDRCVSNGSPVPTCTPSTERVNMAGSTQGDGASSAPSVSADGRSIGFDSASTNLVAGDTNASRDAFVASDCRDAVCGDGNLVVWCEQCDDGNLVDGDGCDSNCRLTGCGNGRVTDSEQCDDGNLVDGDGCDSSCEVETGWACPTPGQPCQPICGDGMRVGSEECDDGNTTSGDGCSATCRSELIPGGGSPKTDCVHEWFVDPVPPPDAKGRPRARLECRDDDPTCDFGAATGDKACTFHVRLCFNVSEWRTVDATGAPLCKATDVARVQFKRPREDRPLDSTDVANRDALEAALAPSGVVRGQCVNIRQRLCHVDTNSDCDSGPGSGDGICRGRFVVFAPPLSTADTCTPATALRVPLKQTAKGAKKRSKRLTLKVTTSKGSFDTDSLYLVCTP